MAQHVGIVVDRVADLPEVAVERLEIRAGPVYPVIGGKTLLGDGTPDPTKLAASRFDADPVHALDSSQGSMSLGWVVAGAAGQPARGLPS